MMIYTKLMKKQANWCLYGILLESFILLWGNTLISSTKEESLTSIKMKYLTFSNGHLSSVNFCCLIFTQYSMSITSLESLQCVLPFLNFHSQQIFKESTANICSCLAMLFLLNQQHSLMMKKNSKKISLKISLVCKWTFPEAKISHGMMCSQTLAIKAIIHLNSQCSSLATIM